MCDTGLPRYKCICPSYTSGLNCEDLNSSDINYDFPKTCKEQAQRMKNSSTGIYSLVDGNGTEFKAFCDFSSEPNVGWTLIQAFTFKRNALFRFKSLFDDDMPINSELPNWDAYRLPKSRMLELRNVSTYWRVTCNYTSGINFRDYLKTTFSNFDIMTYSSGGKCRKYNFLDIRGNTCTNCTAWTYYSPEFPPLVESYNSRIKGCQFDGRINGGIKDESNFGYYGVANPNFTCTSSPGATTEYWFGSY